MRRQGGDEDATWRRDGPHREKAKLCPGCTKQDFLGENPRLTHEKKTVYGDNKAERDPGPAALQKQLLVYFGVCFVRLPTTRSLERLVNLAKSAYSRKVRRECRNRPFC